MRGENATYYYIHFTLFKDEHLRKQLILFLICYYLELFLFTLIIGKTFPQYYFFRNAEYYSSMDEWEVNGR